MNTQYLLDNCAISEFAKPNPNAAFVAYMQTLPEHALFLSTLTLGELQKGNAKLADGARKNEITLWLQAIENTFANRVIGFDAHTAKTWGNLVANLDSSGKTKPTIDSMLAATAVQHNFILITRNSKNFTDFPITVINPWQ